MKSPSPHGNPALHRAGLCAMAVGAALVVVPALPANRLANVHELLTLTQWALSQKYAGVCALMLGNTLRLIGLQVHQGLPWPLVTRGVPPKLVAKMQVRRRAWENPARAAVRRYWRLRRAGRLDLTWRSG